MMRFRGCSSIGSNSLIVSMTLSLVPGAGLEPARVYHSLDFKSNASTNSATPADSLTYKYIIRKLLIECLLNHTGNHSRGSCSIGLLDDFSDDELDRIRILSFINIGNHLSIFLEHLID